jgi:hypothetical protein
VGQLLPIGVPLSWAFAKGADKVMPLPETSVPPACANFNGITTVIESDGLLFGFPKRRLAAAIEAIVAVSAFEPLPTVML